MQGPTTATMRLRSAPRPIMVSTAAPGTPPSAPRQPEWTAATTRASASA